MTHPMLTDPARAAKRLRPNQWAYLRAVKASEAPYEPRHGTTANWALRHKLVGTIVRANDGREGFWGEFAFEDVVEILGQRLTPAGAHLLTESTTNAGE